MSSAWPPPTGEPNITPWVQPEATIVPPPQPGIEPANPWAAPVAAPLQNSWPPPQPGAPPPNYWMPQQAPPDRALDWVLPVRRSGLSIAAGYVSLFSVFVWIAAPVGVVLGILALRDLQRQPHLLGKGRAWFAIIFGGFMTLVLLAVVSSTVLRMAAG